MKRASNIILRNMLLATLSLAMVLTMVSCGENETDEVLDFDRSSLLQSLASELIIPNFEDLQSSVNGLSAAFEAFNSEANVANLQAMRTAWVSAVSDFQHTSAFGFGPADLPLGAFATVIGVFPVNEQGIENNIGDPNFNLASTFQRDIRGFYAVEYLIYGNDLTDEQMVSGFNQDRKDYLNLLIDDLKTTVDNILSEWNSGYMQEFVSDNGTSAGSSISLLYNAFIKDYENLKNFKIELPAGLTAGTDVNPTLVEAFYSGVSRDLIVAHFENSKNIWFGRSKGGQDLIGFQEYLQEIVGGQDLIDSTLPVIANIDNAISALPQGRLSENIEANQVTSLRDLLQSNTANFKSSMSSLLGISITFNSGDGD